MRLLLNTSDKQKNILLENIEKSQLNAIVQIVYNILHGYRTLSKKDKKQVAKRKAVIRLSVSKGVSLKRRKQILAQHFKYILPFIEVIRSELD